MTILQQQVSNLESSAFRTIQLRAEAAATAPEGSPGEFASATDSRLNRRWTEVTMQVNSSAMKSESSTSTSFSETNWNVDLFFGSAGGNSRDESEQFASNYLSASSSIQIGMLATKVLIQRPWMHPEIFNLSKKFYRVIDDAVTTPIVHPQGGWIRPQLVPKELGGGENVSAAAAGKNCADINQAIFPAYPVALLLVKDVTIKIQCDATKTQALQSYSQQNSSQGGGFLCFSVSREQASSSSNKSANSYAMAGDYVFRIPAPQVAGVWLQITPNDNSTVLNTETAQRIADSLGFLTKVKNVAATGLYTETAPQAKAS